MQITNSVVCGRSKGCIYKQIKPPLVDEHVFFTDGVCLHGGPRYTIVLHTGHISLDCFGVSACKSDQY